MRVRQLTDMCWCGNVQHRYVGLTRQAQSGVCSLSMSAGTGKIKVVSAARAGVPRATLSEAEKVALPLRSLSVLFRLVCSLGGLVNRGKFNSILCCSLYQTHTNLGVIPQRQLANYDAAAALGVKQQVNTFC